MFRSAARCSLLLHRPALQLLSGAAGSAVGGVGPTIIGSSATPLAGSTGRPSSALSAICGNLPAGLANNLLSQARCFALIGMEDDDGL
ncbi:hypothetical protein CHLRE_09g393210v5 [Chlamydomonas reinhardtii]|uniref:Uncharacterized protein n=1 Tax=Chlamydomonas reinhardtii TaxID=3055 RepID=A0A2K3DEC0_CHLRE|nr:uncharacterized protein CHLRE_09g393210v5 [Chlamydomonas reinhardtii]PNW78883.1 hypothetical protein CHLRE_09g393210v5 [Chlamydomonas reinhardtii]